MRKYEKKECAGCEFLETRPLPWAPDQFDRFCTWGKAKKKKRLHRPHVYKHCNLINKDGY